MNPVAPRDTLTPAEAAALRARIIARVARDRFAPPTTMTALHFIASHLDRAAEAFERNAPRNAAEALNDAREIAQLHPDTRFPSNFTDYVEAPVTGVALPMLAPFNPVNPALAQREADLRHRLTLVHAQLAQATSESATDAWLPSALTYQRDLMRLAGEVRVDNARPCNQRQPEPAPAEVAEPHLKCPKCGSTNVRPSVREWATCQNCRHGDLWAAFKACDCWGYDCPALNG
ncbi:hypothetical protein QR97_01800 [Streptomyces sp. PBH53]|uniref:hypothetical protein n=1 Tax=Streptomyces sp. PBH53 TaxID=1577075 RepID=UPI000654E12C|nr:hypothetical protein [Streptomyces sp. PBH53]AKN68706.1 hypothetical protein QR97_01800 [Streptomyces sp. PBH53]